CSRASFSSRVKVPTCSCRSATDGAARDTLRVLGLFARRPLTGCSLRPHSGISDPLGGTVAVPEAIQSHITAPRASLGGAIGLRSMLEGFVPTIPDWANDQHTLAGRKLGRGLDHFYRGRESWYQSRPLINTYEDEAYRLWAIKQHSK